MSWRARVKWPWLSLSLLTVKAAQLKALLDAKSVITSITVASGLGSTSAYTWLNCRLYDGHGAGYGSHYLAGPDFGWSWQG